MAIKQLKTAITGLVPHLNLLQANINKTEADAIVREGSLSGLNTSVKSSLVDSINGLLGTVNTNKSDAIVRMGVLNTDIIG